MTKTSLAVTGPQEFDEVITETSPLSSIARRLWVQEVKLRS